MAKHTILLVDDDEAMRLALSRALERGGYQVVQASNGKSACALLEKQPIDLMITDIIMPEMEGLALIYSARERAKDLPIIAISGGLQGQAAGFLGMAELSGASVAFAKPVELGELLVAVRKLLMGRPDRVPGAAQT